MGTVDIGIAKACIFVIYKMIVHKMYLYLNKYAVSGCMPDINIMRWKYLLVQTLTIQLNLTLKYQSNSFWK